MKLIIFNRWTKARRKRGIFLFKMPFHLSRYHFRFSRYRRVKRRVIFNLFLFPSLFRLLGSLARTWPAWKSVRVFPRKKYRSQHHPVIHSNNRFKQYTLSLYISATDRDIGMKRKKASMAVPSISYTCFDNNIYIVYTKKMKGFYSWFKIT